MKCTQKYMLLLIVILSIAVLPTLGLAVVDPGDGDGDDGVYRTAKGGRAWFQSSGDYTDTKIDDGDYYKAITFWFIPCAAGMQLWFDFSSLWDYQYILVEVYVSGGSPKLNWRKHGDSHWGDQTTLHNGYNVVSVPSNALIDGIWIGVPWPHSVKVDYCAIYYYD